MENIQSEIKPKIYRFYSSAENPNRIAVIGEYENGVLNIAVSRCSNNDIFLRKRGRAIAEGRLHKGRLHSIFHMKQPKTEAFIEIASSIIKMVHIDKISVPKEPYIYNEKETI